MKKRIILAGLLAALLFVLPFGVGATVVETEPETTEIHTTDDLLAMADDPAGSYTLMADLDMTGIAWKPLDFTGTFDGNGYSILNLTITQTGDKFMTTYDGNYKQYDTCFAGFFGTLKGARVVNLHLINLRSVIVTDYPCFLGGIAGYSSDSTIFGCTVTGELELRAHDRMFGVGGIVGFGGGSVERCTVDVTLICTDTDATKKDEQFMGGVLGAGYMDITDCQITLDGYSSEHGYAHNGGIVGMCVRNPAGDRTDAKITGNAITGKITFFENNYDRRAYCKPIVGEMMTSYCVVSDNTEEFENNEQFSYDKELRPEMCAEPTYTETVVAAGCDTYGYTEYKCDTCGYTYTDHYTFFEHVVTIWNTEKEPTTEEEGLSIGTCTCGEVKEERVEATLPTEPPTEPPTEAPTEAPTEVPTEAPETEPPATEPPVQEPEGNGGKWVIIVVILVAALATAVVLFLLHVKNKPGAFLQERTRNED